MRTTLIILCSCNTRNYNNEDWQVVFDIAHPTPNLYLIDFFKYDRNMLKITEVPSETQAPVINLVWLEWAWVKIL